MAAGVVKTFEWSYKIEVKKTTAYLAGLFVVFIYTTLKVKPYFVEAPMLNIFIGSKSQNPSDKKHPGSDVGHPNGVHQGTPFDKMLNIHLGGRGAQSTGRDQRGHFVIERPLFDGAMVTLKAVLLEGVSSNSGIPTIQAKLFDTVDASKSYEYSF